MYFSGWRLLRAMSFPLAFLLFAIPIPVLIYNEIVFPLQFMASSFATRILEMLNLFPIMREGNVLIMPGMRLEVVEACSGIRSLMSLLASGGGIRLPGGEERTGAVVPGSGHGAAGDHQQRNAGDDYGADDELHRAAGGRGIHARVLRAG